jgi:REP-associated tyrosine transposase
MLPELNRRREDRLSAITPYQSGDPHFWQPGGGYDRNIISGHELLEKVNYIHTNPVRRGLVKHVIDWPWSSARWYDRRVGMVMDTLPL